MFPVKLFRHPTASEVMAREKAEAQLDLLSAIKQREFFESMEAMYRKRIARIEAEEKRTAQQVAPAKSDPVPTQPFSTL